MPRTKTVITKDSIFGLWLVLGKDTAKSKSFGASHYRCQCSCGHTRTVKAQSLLSGKSTNCGCQRKLAVAESNRQEPRSNPIAINLQGSIAGNLLVLDRQGNDSSRHALWRCRCLSCRLEQIYRGTDLIREVAKCPRCQEYARSVQERYGH